MKKVFTALLISMFAVVFAATAYAADTEREQAYEAESDKIYQATSQRVRAYLAEEAGVSRGRTGAVKLSGAQCQEIGRAIDQIMREEYEKAGWTEVISGARTAQEVYEIVSQDVDERAVKLAYMDLDNTPAELHDYILSARREIIYRFSWSADYVAGELGYGSAENPDDRTFEISPRFSDLFPGWYEPELDLELPDWRNAPDSSKPFSVKSIKTTALVSDLVSPLAETDWFNQFQGSVYLSTPGSSYSAAFTMFNVYNDGETRIRSKASYLAYSKNYNLGVTDMTNNISKKAWTGCALGTYYRYDWAPQTSVMGGMRASTYSNPGTSTMTVDLQRSRV